MLFDPSRHEPLQERTWDEAQARAAIERHRARRRDALLAAGVLAPLAARRRRRRHRADVRSLLRCVRGDLGARLSARGGRRDARARLHGRPRTPACPQPGVARKGTSGRRPQRVVPLRRHRHPDGGAGASPGRGDVGPSRSADRRQPRPPFARADVGRAGHHARGVFCTGRRARRAGRTGSVPVRARCGRSSSASRSTAAASGCRTSMVTGSSTWWRCTASSPA